MSFSVTVPFTFLDCCCFSPGVALCHTSSAKKQINKLFSHTLFSDEANSLCCTSPSSDSPSLSALPLSLALLSLHLLITSIFYYQKKKEMYNEWHQNILNKIFKTFLFLRQFSDKCHSVCNCTFHFSRLLLFPSMTHVSLCHTSSEKKTTTTTDKQTVTHHFQMKLTHHAVGFTSPSDSLFSLSLHHLLLSIDLLLSLFHLLL